MSLKGMNINIIKIFKFLSIISLINFSNITEIESAQKKVLENNCAKTDINLIKKLNSSIAERKVYRKGDKLTFTLYNSIIDDLLENSSEELFGLNGTIIETKVNSLGYVYLPKAEPIYIDGLKTEQVKEKIKTALKSRYKEPIISIERIEPPNVRVTIEGQVLNPGDYIISGFEEEDLESINQTSRTLKKLFVKSGGILNSADYENIVLLRDNKCFLIDATLLVGRNKVDFILSQDDTIVVNNSKSLNRYNKKYVDLGNSQLSAKNQTIYIYGLVNNPGAIEVDWFNNPNVTVAIAGGIQRGGSANVLIAYKNNLEQTYEVQKTRVSLQDKSFLSGANVPLTHKSIIVISRSPYSKIIEFMKDITLPVFTYKSLENTLNN